MPLSTLRSFDLGTPRGLFGNSGSMIDHSKSESSYRRGVIFAPPRELESHLAQNRNLEASVRSAARFFRGNVADLIEAGLNEAAAGRAACACKGPQSIARLARTIGRGSPGNNGTTLALWAK